MPPNQLIRKRDTPQILGISRSTLANWMNPKSQYFRENFPPQVRLSDRLMGFRLHDLEAWIEANTERHNSTK